MISGRLTADLHVQGCHTWAMSNTAILLYFVVENPVFLQGGGQPSKLMHRVWYSVCPQFTSQSVGLQGVQNDIVGAVPCFAGQIALVQVSMGSIGTFAPELDGDVVSTGHGQLLVSAFSPSALI